MLVPDLQLLVPVDRFSIQMREWFIQVQTNRDSRVVCLMVVVCLFICLFFVWFFVGFFSGGGGGNTKTINCNIN